jgi:hypothetical protein
VDFNYNSNHIEGNKLTYGQTEILLLFGKLIGEADVRDVQEMTASNVGLKMMSLHVVRKETLADGSQASYLLIAVSHNLSLTDGYSRLVLQRKAPIFIYAELAQGYENESEVGLGIADSGVPRWSFRPSLGCLPLPFCPVSW